VVLCGYETWSLTLREKHTRRLRVFENGVLKEEYLERREIVKGGWRKLHNEEFHNLYSSSSVIRMIK
jgi:hypothetical protein